MGADPRRQSAQTRRRALTRTAAGDPRHILGRDAEACAAAHLVAAGAQILMRNFRRRSGEIDLVALLRDTLLVVEVRCRSGNDFGGGAASVHAVKQARLVRTALQLLQQRPDLAQFPVRFDVIVATPRSASTTDGFGIEWIPHAFEAGR